MNIVVLDAQGAGIGKAVIKQLNKKLNKKFTITALATNQIAYENMLKAGATKGFFGENTIKKYIISQKFDCIIGPIGIIASGGILGEITPEISRLIFESDCKKYIIPLNLHKLFIPGTTTLQIKDSIDMIIADIQESLL